MKSHHVFPAAFHCLCVCALCGPGTLFLSGGTCQHLRRTPGFLRSRPVTVPAVVQMPLIFVPCDPSFATSRLALSFGNDGCEQGLT